MPRPAPPSSKVTEPVGWSPVTVAVTTTGWPGVVGLRSDATEVVVAVAACAGGATVSSVPTTIAVRAHRTRAFSLMGSR